ncbi:GGDEF domain-containing protein [Deinococcus multiflagellatus]|uniref:GGDEF domain-containing protein n=1 Tax=Deinococcus multiflagellatus TaxID=1656887 RepID=A0ABW1ZM07_9DEIO
MMHLDDDLFEHLPLPAVHWTPGHPARLNRAFTRAFGLGPLPLPLLDRPDGAHHTRLSTPNGEARICRLLLRTLPGGDRLGVVEDVHDYHADPLTRLPDRRALLLDADQGAPVTLALLDIDGLARVNHRAGPAAGDAALHALAELLKRAARHWPAQAYRLGGGRSCCARRTCWCLGISARCRTLLRGPWRRSGCAGPPSRSGWRTPRRTAPPWPNCWPTPSAACSAVSAPEAGAWLPSWPTCCATCA